MRAISWYDTHVRRAVAIFAGSIGVSVFLYGMLLLGAVAHAAGRTTAEREITRLSAEVNALETQYLAKTIALSPERAASMGFVAPAAVATVYAAPAGGLTLR